MTESHYKIYSDMYNYYLNKVSCDHISNLFMTGLLSGQLQPPILIYVY